jgi:multisubunit Na+/H+ antiporter MnhC subunit
LCVFKEGRRERGREKKKKKKGHGTALVSPLKQILVILALVIYKILKTSLCN